MMDAHSREAIEQGQATCALTNLRKAMRSATQMYDEALAPSGLRSTQYSVLAAIRLRDGVSMSHLAHQLVMDRTTLTRNLKPLEREGLIRIAAGRDARTRLIALTDAGREALQEAAPLRMAAQRTVEEALGETRYAALLDGLRGVVQVATER